MPLSPPTSRSGSGIPESLLDAIGDMIVASAADTAARLAIGADDTVLTADSGEPLGVKWAAGGGGGIPESLLDAKGDIIGASAADTAARLAVGTDFVETLLPDSSQATGLRYGIRRSAARPSGSLAETMSRLGLSATSNTVTLASGTLRLQAIELPKGVTVNSISFFAGNTALSVGSNQWFALFDASRVQLAITGDDTSTAWAAETVKTLALTAPFATTYAGLYYLGCLVVATTPPTLQGVATRAPISALAPNIGGNSDAGLTNPASCPATAAAPSGSNAQAWAYVS